MAFTDFSIAAHSAVISCDASAWLSYSEAPAPSASASEKGLRCVIWPDQTGTLRLPSTARASRTKGDSVLSRRGGTPLITPPHGFFSGPREAHHLLMAP